MMTKINKIINRMTPWFFRSSGVFLGNEKEKREERKNFHHSPTGPSP
jgi:hypothetical protein